MTRQQQHGSANHIWILMVALMCALSVGGVVAARSAWQHGRRYASYCIDPTYGLPLPEAHAHPLGKPPAWIWASTVG
ncbi:MAG: hypothetical protein ACP5I8_16165, partial [Phycisphaerae bacterium]